MQKQNKILPIWQPVGFSTHIIAKKVSEKFGVKTSHTGTLDPMAEGIIIVLLDDERLKKYEYAKWNKTYEFEIAFGIETDTFDGLGLITQKNFDTTLELSQESIIEVLGTFRGSYHQTVPPYSAIKLRGKPLHYYAREGIRVDLPTREVAIYSIKLTALTTSTYQEFIGDTMSKVKSVTGDLRQEKILRQWETELLLPHKQELKIAKITVESSKGMYVRALSQDICKQLNTIGITSKIVRTENGIFNKSNSRQLREIIDTY